MVMHSLHLAIDVISNHGSIADNANYMRDIIANLKQNSQSHNQAQHNQPYQR
jgi:hypothetical protein